MSRIQVVRDELAAHLTAQLGTLAQVHSTTPGSPSGAGVLVGLPNRVDTQYARGLERVQLTCLAFDTQRMTRAAEVRLLDLAERVTVALRDLPGASWAGGVEVEPWAAVNAAAFGVAEGIGLAVDVAVIIPTITT